jgi:hypothetical protein
VLTATYLLPIRAASPPSEELTDYLREVSSWCPLVVVDGSAPEVFAAAHERWASFAAHVAPAPDLRCANGKVHGVLTGLRLVTTPALVIADDDVRYTRESFTACVAALRDADLVRPQNHFDPMPWHARWDTGRILLNRVSGGDFPGTLLVRTDVLVAAGGYDGDVLFENLELIRSVARAGGRCSSRPDLYVRRTPPTTSHFLGQRVRQAYDELARPERLVVQLAVAPAVVWLASTGRWRALVACALAVVGLAEVGRRRAGGRSHFPPSASWLAPVWVVERGLCVWPAMWYRLRGGVPYAGGRLVRAANPRPWRRRLRSPVLG